MRAIFVTCSSFLIHSLCKTNERRMHLLEHFINAHKPLFLQSFMCSSMIIWTFSLTRVVLSLHPLTVFCTLLQYNTLERISNRISERERPQPPELLFVSSRSGARAFPKPKVPASAISGYTCVPTPIHLLAVQSVQPYVIY
jgi:hypothetical protein